MERIARRVSAEFMKQRLLQGLEKLLWAVLGGVLVAAGQAWIRDSSPKIIVRQYYNTVENSEVPKQVGDLVIDYQPPPPTNKSTYLIEVSNEGRGPEEDLRLHASFPDGLRLAFATVPDLRVYKPDTVALEDHGFFMELRGFPKKARAEISFVPPEERKVLCNVAIKVIGANKAGRVENLKGVECD